LAQAISSTSPTEPNSTSRMRRRFPTTWSTSETTLMVKVRSRLSFSRIREAITEISACACSSVTPGLRRAVRL
jgi:hypothetical protein